MFVGLTCSDIQKVKCRPAGMCPNPKFSLPLLEPCVRGCGASPLTVYPSAQPGLRMSIACLISSVASIRKRAVVALGVALRDVAGHQPAVDEGTRRRDVVAPVARKHVRPAHEQLPF